MASNLPPVKGQTHKVDFVIRDTEGEVVANPSNLAAVVSTDEAAGAASDNSPACYDTTYGFCSLVVSASEMNGDRIAVLPTSDDGWADPIFLETVTKTFDGADAAAALAAYDPPTKVEMDTALSLLNDLSAADVAAAVWGAVVASYKTVGTFGYFIYRLFGRFFWKRTVTDDVETFYDESNVKIAEKTITDDGTTWTSTKES